jgi:chromosome partitioning protein
MGKIIALVNQKGGVGKTTTSVNLAAYLARYGKKVLLVDIDPQGNASSGLGVRLKDSEEHIYHALVQPDKFPKIIRNTSVDSLHIAPASSSLAGAAIELVSVPQREYRLRQLLEEAKLRYDYIIIDSPPSLGLLTINGLVAADEVLIPVQAEYYALEGLGQLLKTISLVQSHLHRDLLILGAVITMYDKRNKLSQAVMNELYQYFPNRIFRSVIPRSVRLAEAPSHGLPIMLYDYSSRGGRAYEKLAQEVLNNK